MQIRAVQPLRLRSTAAPSAGDEEPISAGRRLPAADGLLALAGGAAVLVEALIRAPTGVSPVAFLLVVLAAAPITVRSITPLRALLAVAVGAVLCAAVLHAGWTVTAIIGFALYNVALRGDRRRSLIVGVLTATAVAAAVLAIDATVEAGALATRVVLVCMCAVAGELVRSRDELRLARAERAERDARERREQLRRHAAAERIQIARELHDTLAHSLVAINVRASVAVDLRDPDDAAAALSDIKRASAGALQDLRSTLSVLRDTGDDAPTAPARGLDALTGLVDNARSAGIDTELSVELDPETVPAAAIAATVRIVQESLTNVIRHAQATHASVAVRVQGGALRIQIADDGVARPSSSGDGFGLLGMRERATALGGSLQAGARPDGGWMVDAELPLPGTVS